MLHALLYLRLASARNWLWSRLRRLRQPKYLAGAVVGAAYFWFFFFRPLAGAGLRPRTGPGTGSDALQHAAALPGDWLPAIAALGALALLAILALMWIAPRQPASLGFTEAEFAFLFPAPLARRTLVHFRLLSAQFRSVVGAAIMMLFSNRWQALGGNAVTHAIGWWFIFSALNLHFTGSGLALTALGESRGAVWLRRALAGAGLVALVAASALRLPQETRYPALTAGFAFGPIADWIVAVTGVAPLSWVLWPLRLVLAPFLAADGGAFLGTLAPALAVIGLHYFWVVRTAVSFEDAAVQHAEKRAARVAAWRAGDRRIGGGPARGRRPPFRLRSTGRPELAFLWKNLLSTWPYFTPRMFAGAAVGLVAVCLWLGRQPDLRGFLPILGGLALGFAGYTLIVGPQFARQDIRMDLPNTDILKTYPLSGWQIVLGQLLAPTAILTGVLWLAWLTIALAAQPPVIRAGWLTPELRIAGALAIGLLTPVLAMLQLLVPNAAALLFPGWFQASRGRGGGVEVVGQRMIFFFAQVLTMALALAPPAAMAGAIVFILQVWIDPAIAVTLATFAALAVLAGEVWCGIWWLGDRFDRLDLSLELKP